MSAQALAIRKQASVNLRPFDMRRDLLSVAGLVELCFAESLDADGRLYIRQMRQAARSGSLMSLASTDVQLGGMVWEEGGKVIGNLSLIPQYFQNRRMYLIANVAVHPDYRRRGIGRALTQAALEEIDRRGRMETWLQVDEDNPAAVNLYRGMGFMERVRRTSWRLEPTGESEVRHFAGITVCGRRAADWSRQKDWLEGIYPEELRWHLPLDFGLLQPGLMGALQRSLSDRQAEQWSAEWDGELLGVLTWQSSSLEADRLWLAAAADREGEAIPALINHMQSQVRAGRKLALNYPARRATAALTEAGFSAARTLIWMQFPESN